MKRNVGDIDRIVRGVLGTVALVLGIALGGWWWLLAGLGLILVATATLAFCPLYLPFGISTHRPKS